MDEQRATYEAVRRHLTPGIAAAGRLAGHGAVERSAEGCRVVLSDGRTVLDFGSYAVTLLGHRHPAVVAAVRQQLDVQATATRTLLNPVTAAAAARVVDYLGAPLRRVYFGLSGSDAIECVLKLARVASGRTRVVAVEGAFHGKSLGALALTHHTRYRAGMDGVLADVVHVAPDDPDAVARVVRAGDVAAFVFEPVQGENGVRPIDPAVLAAWCASAVEHGTFVVADEVQTGLRRCGEPSLALAAGLPVDAVLLGKPLGGGVLPMSAAVCTDRLYAPLVADPLRHTSTFSGHPLGCAALLAALDAVESLADRGAALAAQIASGLAALHTAHPDQIAAVRGRGLLWGLELTTPEAAAGLMTRLSHAGLLVSPCLGSPTTLRLLPPLVATDDDVTEALTLLDAALRVPARSAAP
jgi:putrescine aminotransferase